MNNALDKIKARIKALSEKTVSNGCTEAEAVSAMTMVSKLLNEYNLNLNRPLDGSTTKKALST